MQSEGQYDNQWTVNGGLEQQPQRRPSSPPMMSANVNGPVDPHEFYRSFTPESDLPYRTNEIQTLSPPRVDGSYTHASASRSFSRSSERAQLRSASGPATSTYQHALNSAKSNPVLLPSRKAGSVKDIASRFNKGAEAGSGQPTLTVRTSNDRYRRPVGGKPRSPVSPGKSERGMVKLQKRRPGEPKSPNKLSNSPATSFDTTSSFGSNATVRTTRSQPHAAFSPKKPATPVTAAPVKAKPLFGEITSDGQWNGNFDLGSYVPLSSFQSSPRRGSDGSIALGHGRSQSHADISRQTFSPPAKTLTHRRSRSDMDAYRPQQPPSMPNLNAINTPSLYPTPPHSNTRNALRKDSPTSRIPVSNRRQSLDSAGSGGQQSRAASAMSNPAGRNRLSKSPTRTRQATGKENTPNSAQNRRYYPPASSPENKQMLSAKIVAPMPKTSPPLRSSRPRQPVSSATTSASRARAADASKQRAQSRDNRKPSEQWLGRSYDPKQERKQRKIPELGKIDFAERRARIQKAISQNLEESKSQEDLKTRSRKTSEVQEPQAEGGAKNSVDQHMEQEMDRETELLDTGQEHAESPKQPERGLSLDTVDIPEHAEREPLTGQTAGTMETEFEIDDSPVLGKTASEQPAIEVLSPQASAQPALLSAAIYEPKPRSRVPSPISPVQEAPHEEMQSPSILDTVNCMRQQGDSSAENTPVDYFEEHRSGEDSPSDIEDRWGLGRSTGDAGSIKIMLDDDPTITKNDDPWPKQLEQEHDHYTLGAQGDSAAESQAHDHEAYTANGYTTNEYSESPVDTDGHTAIEHNESLIDAAGSGYTTNEYSESPVDGGFPEREVQATPRKGHHRDDTLKPSTFQLQDTPPRRRSNAASDDTVARMLAEYNAHGSVTEEMLQQVQNHMVDLQRLSQNGGSDGMMVQNLLDSILNPQPVQEASPQETLQRTQYEMPLVTPDTPPDAAMATGTAVVYSTGTSCDATPEEEDEDFDAKIRKADEEWERRQRGEDNLAGAEDNDFRPPTPPPKDFGYSPRSSAGPNSATFAPDFASGLRISTAGDVRMSDIYAAAESLEATPIESGSTLHVHSPTASIHPPAPTHAPPPPPSPSATRLPYGMPEVPHAPATYSDRASSEMSPRVRKNAWGPGTGSSRPSIDSQRAREPPPLPGSQSMSSFAESTRQTSIDTAHDSQTRLVKTTSPGPEQKRLQKRRHIVLELINTENTYHQDVKIIEDIYKGTVGNMVSAEDVKILFGNCDQIEKFSLSFYDQLRKAAGPAYYVPGKKGVWGNKRGSMSTTHSEATGNSTGTTGEVDEDKDRSTCIGRIFTENLPEMEKVYGAYLRNHDAANQRLSTLQADPTVKCWLNECHNYANDITSAWDLDSLLVKPTQRVSKYPLMLQQLLETTPPGHPDHEALKTAAKDSIAMLTRINEAKKRADLVDQIVNRKRKDSDVRSGLAKAFGRRTEKIKERVGINEAWQDPEFDGLAHKFGGHYIRLQICMRDVQDYVNRVDKAVDQINNYAAALELYTDVSPSSLPEIESKWRRYGQAIRELTAVALTEHKTSVHRRVITPMLNCIKAHEGPQNAINKRKKRIVDYAKCKAIKERGEKPDKKTVEASEMFEALNDQLKIELPKLYELTAALVQGCLVCFLDIQLVWQKTWERKLRPLLEDADVPQSINDIVPAFSDDHGYVNAKLFELSICNGSLLADSANFLSPTSTLVADYDSSKRPSTLTSSKRTMSMGSDMSPSLLTPASSKRHSGSYTPDTSGSEIPPLPNGGRIRSNSSMSNRAVPAMTPASTGLTGRPWSRSNTSTDTSFPTSRPSTAQDQQRPHGPPRISTDYYQRSPRPTSGATYFTARPDQSENHRFSGMFNSAMPPDSPSTRPASPRAAPDDMPVILVCASLFEFNIDKTRKEAGYPYLTYVQGEVFDVVAQKGELWLAKNQDDMTNTLGWIWEQHFVVLSQEG